MIVRVSNAKARVARPEALLGATLCWWPDKVVVLTRAQPLASKYERRIELPAAGKAKARYMAWQYGMWFHDMTATKPEETNDDTGSGRT